MCLVDRLCRDLHLACGQLHLRCYDPCRTSAQRLLDGLCHRLNRGHVRAHDQSQCLHGQFHDRAQHADERHLHLDGHLVRGHFLAPAIRKAAALRAAAFLMISAWLMASRQLKVSLRPNASLRLTRWSPRRHHRKNRHRSFHRRRQRCTDGADGVAGSLADTS